MKGSILRCLDELITKKFGKEFWRRCLADAKFNPSVHFNPLEDVDDTATMQLMQAICTNLDLTLEKVADAFGHHWVHEYSQRSYSSYFRTSHSIRDFLESVNRIHVEITSQLKDTRPPRYFMIDFRLNLSQVL